jgi:PDZ domain
MNTSKSSSWCLLTAQVMLRFSQVFNGSPSDGNLQRGDVLLSINNNDVSAVYLKKAEELVKASANNLVIVVRRYSRT